MISIKYWLLIQVILIISLLLEIWTLKSERSMHKFYKSYNLHSLCQKSACYKNPEKPSCIDLFLTNSPKSFQNTQTIETGLSDFHKLVVTILKMYLPNNPPNVITFRDYKNFDNSRFSEELLSGLRLRNVDHWIKTQAFFITYVSNFLKNIPLKKKSILEQIKQILRCAQNYVIKF